MTDQPQTPDGGAELRAHTSPSGPHPEVALAEAGAPHLDDKGTCECMCANCTVNIGPAEMWRCICPDCDATACGGHGERGFDE